MYEGKNIHYSTVDQKPLCSFSGKVCNQRRLNKYGFCVRHILEDQTAPFKRCAYVAKSSRQTCTQPIPKHEEREYCNNHMQVLGMLPKKERKPKKEKDKFMSSAAIPHSTQTVHLSTDPLLLQNKLKPRLTVGGFKTKIISNKVTSEDVDDIYAFPADNNDNLANRSNSVSTMITSIAIPDMSPNSSKALTYSTYRSKSPSEGTGGHTSLAKIYPELAEKLEKIKPRVEPKLKGKVKSSRTMNSLQTKIAQNKIKDKLRRNQGSNASSQSQSPSHGFANSPGYHISVSSPSVSVTSPGPTSVSVASPGIPSTSQVTTTSHERQPAVTSVPETLPSSTASHMTNINPQPILGLSQLNPLNSLNLQTLNLSLAQLGLPVPTASDIEQTLKQLAKAANIPLDGAMLSQEGATGLQPPNSLPGLSSGVLLPPPELLGMLRPTFTPQSGPPPPYSSVHHRPSVPIANVSFPNSTQTLSASKNQIRSEKQVTSSQINKPLVTPHTLASVSPSVSRVVRSSTALTLPGVVKTTSSALSHSSPSSVVQQRQSHAFPSFSTLSKPMAVTKTSSESVQQSMSSGTQQKTKVTKARPSRARNPSSASKRPVPVFTLPMTVAKPRKIRKLLDDSDLKKLKSKSAIQYYDSFRKEKIYNHNLIISGFDSSDESDLSDCDMLPWQPDWFNASSDEEACDDDDDDDLDYNLRTTKLALTRARLRRQCFQARRSHRVNMVVGSQSRQSTSALIATAREIPTSAITCLNEISGKKPKPVDRFKIRGLEKRKCLYKDNDDVQCKNIVVPYANHCIKHVMYNVDQQLFEYCTAKFADNTQCCHPVIDVKHELPLCMEHGLKADNFLKIQDAEPKPKRPRKKTKPSALTRPPKKGKKKKNQRKCTRPQKPLPPEEPSEMSETEEEATAASHDDDDDDADGVDDDTDTESSSQKELGLTKSAILKTSVPLKSTINPVQVMRPVIKVESKPSVLVVPKEERSDKTSTSATGHLEELDNLSALTELDNVKMFGDLPLETASKLLEENDFQEVLNRLPDEAFDIFSNKSTGLPSNEELEELEKSLAMANRDFNMAKDVFDQMATTPSVEQIPTTQQHQQQQQQQQQQQHQQSLPPILDEADELTRQIAEEILNQNLGQDINIGHSLCNGDAQESIKAIARSLSNSGMMLTSEASQRSSQGQDYSMVQSPISKSGLSISQPSGLSRSQSLQGYSNLGQVYNPPNVAIQSIPHGQTQQTRVQVQSLPNTLTLNQGQISQGHLTVPGQGHPAMTPRNVTVTPQGILQAQFPSVSPIFTPVSQNVTIGNAVITGPQMLPGNQNASIINFAGPQSLTAQQLSQLVQQATIQLPPLPPYTPRQQATTATSQTVHSNPVTLQAQKQLTQEQITQQLQQQQQQLARQQEQLTQQQNILAQQLLQQHLATFAQQNQLAQATKVVQPATQSLSISTLLQQGHIAPLGKMNQPTTQSVSTVGQIPQLIKSSNPNSSTVSMNLPSTNIVWTAPPNVTITSPNGIPRSISHSAVSSAKLVPNSSNKASMKDAFIDLTDTNDPPAYQVAQQVLGLVKTQPPPSYPTQTLTTTSLTGK